MTHKYQVQELDDATRAYLLSVRDKRGVGFPGLFIGDSSWMPVLGLIFGIAILGVTAWWTLPPLDDPMNVAMLQTAGLLLGGWMVVAAFRIWALKGGQNHLGHFVYADARRLYEVSGPAIKVTELDDLRGAEGTDNFNDGTYTNTAINVHLGDHRYDFSVNGQEPAHQLVNFLNALAFFRTEESGEIASMPDAARGALALAVVFDLPQEHAGVAEAIAAFPTLPEPQRTGRAPSAWLAYLTIAAVAVAGLFGLRWLNTGWRDDALFAEAKQTGRAPDLRGYLLDPRNTRNRAEAQRLLARHYDPIIERVRQEAKDPQLRDGFVALLTALKSAFQPYASVRVKEETKHAAPNADRERVLQQMLTQALLQVIHEELIVLVQAPPEIPPMIEVVYGYEPHPTHGGAYQLKWNVSLRTKPEDQPVRRTLTSPHPCALGTGHEEVIHQSMVALAGVVHHPRIIR